MLERDDDARDSVAIAPFPLKHDVQVSTHGIHRPTVLRASRGRICGRDRILTDVNIAILCNDKIRVDSTRCLMLHRTVLESSKAAITKVQGPKILHPVRRCRERSRSAEKK